MMTAPEVIAHADWGTHPQKRQVAVATLNPVRDAGEYVVASLGPAPDDLLDGLVRLANAGRALVGFDFPIGLPAAFAKAANISSFREFVASQLGVPPWDVFADIASRADEISLHRPFYPRAPGGTSRSHLYAGLRLGAEELRRSCERKDAECLFWTLGGKQVGKGALSGWNLIALAIRRDPTKIALWPFDGPLEELLAGPARVVIVETYPREYYRFLGAVVTGGKRWSKRRRGDRLELSPAIQDWARVLGVRWEPNVLSRIEAGFGETPTGEDEFDAVVGLLAMIAVSTGAIVSGEPTDDDAVGGVEGWIVGRPRYLDVPMPPWFALESQLDDGNWMDEAVCTPDLFSRCRDGSYLREDGGSGLRIRAETMDRMTGIIDHIDGGGERHRYRLVPLPDPRYPNLSPPKA